METSRGHFGRDRRGSQVRAETVDKMCSLLKGASVRKMPYLIKDATGCLSCARQLAEGARLVPVFQVSNVTGEGLDLLRLFLNALPARREWVGLRDEKAEFCIDDAFQARRPSGIECPSVLATCFKTTSPACCKSHRKRASPSCQRCSDDPARGRGSGPSEYRRGTPRRGRPPRGRPASTEYSKRPSRSASASEKMRFRRSGVSDHHSSSSGPCSEFDRARGGGGSFVSRCEPWWLRRRRRHRAVERSMLEAVGSTARASIATYAELLVLALGDPRATVAPARGNDAMREPRVGPRVRVARTSPARARLGAS